LEGNYTILDVEYAKVGIRKEIWHGWGYAKRHRDEFLKHKNYQYFGKYSINQLKFNDLHNIV